MENYRAFVAHKLVKEPSQAFGEIGGSLTGNKLQKTVGKIRLQELLMSGLRLDVFVPFQQRPHGLTPQREGQG